MACACKVNQELDYLHRKYGKNIPVSKKTMIRFRVREFFNAIAIWMVALPIMPFLFLQILYKAIFSKDKMISAKKMLRFVRG